VAGNVLGSECLGSLDYAVTHLGESIKLIVVLGHSNCGAVTATVDAFLNPSRYLQVASSHSLRAVVDRIFVPVRAAAKALEHGHGVGVTGLPGYRAAMIEMSVVLNAAYTAATLEKEFSSRLGPGRDVVYGVYNLSTGRVKLPLVEDANVAIRLAHPPKDENAFDNLGLLLATCGTVTNMLAGK
jgi:carbonic anhydrase